MTLLAGDPQSFLKGLKNLADKATAPANTPKESPKKAANIEKIKKFVSNEIISIEHQDVKKLGGSMTGIIKVQCKITNISNEIIHGVQGTCYVLHDGKRVEGSYNEISYGNVGTAGLNAWTSGSTQEPIAPGNSVVKEVALDIKMSEEMWKSVLENKTIICIFDGLVSENEEIQSSDYIF
jgi:hypothetical protein